MSTVKGSPEIEHYPWSAHAPGLMRHLDVLVLPSYQEPFGTVLAEAIFTHAPRRRFVQSRQTNTLPEIQEDRASAGKRADGESFAIDRDFLLA